MPRTKNDTASRKKTSTSASSVAEVSIWTFRRPERQIFLASFFLVLLGFFSVMGSRYAEGLAVASVAPLDFSQWIPLAIWTLSLICIHFLMILTKSRVDPVVSGLAMCLVGFGILAQYRMLVFAGVYEGNFWLKPGALALPLGFLLMISVHQLFRGGRYRMLNNAWFLWLVLSIAVVGFVLATGTRFRGAVMASGNITPTEVLKVLIPMSIAGFLAWVIAEPVKKSKKDKSSNKPNLWTWLFVSVCLLSIIAGLVYQKDLGMVLIICVSIGFQIFAGVGTWWILPIMGLGMILAIGLIQSLFTHAMARFDVWLDPFSDPTNEGWQILQSFSGMYSGGLFGEGWGQGDPERIPIAQSDFIYAVIGEEMGFLGCLIMILMFGIFICRAYQISEIIGDRFGKLLASGLVSVLAVQVVVNIGGVVKALPMTGVPLNFVSHGGTSLVTSFIILGFILALNDSPEEQPKKKRNTRKKKIPNS